MKPIPAHSDSNLTMLIRNGAIKEMMCTENTILDITKQNIQYGPKRCDQKVYIIGVIIL